VSRSLVLRTPERPFPGLPGQSNVLAFSLAGTGQVGLSVLAKRPGIEDDLEPATVALPFADLPGADPLPPYARLIHDVLVGDRSLFTRPDGLAATWRTIRPLLDHPPRPLPYPQGSWGPAKARRLAGPGRWLLGQ
jgi:glucose-6-phosphate 1-dehydrogenase